MITVLSSSGIEMLFAETKSQRPDLHNLKPFSVHGGMGGASHVLSMKHGLYIAV